MDWATPVPAKSLSFLVDGESRQTGRVREGRSRLVLQTVAENKKALGEWSVTSRDGRGA
jgi:hypothetical protein